MSNPESVVGVHLGLKFPTSIEPLMTQGAAFLTKAFHASGALRADNRVVAIRSATEFFGGGMGRKLAFDVEYAQSDPALQSHLFVKFPRNFGDPLRSLFAPMMESEVRFALLSRRADFPVTVPRCYFADFDPQSGTGILITERVAYGTGIFENCHDKCMDYQLPDPLGHYRALTRSMGRLAGAHQAGKLGPDINLQFPFEAKKIDVGASIPYTPQQLQAKLQKLRSFAAENPHLLPDSAGSLVFLSRFADEAPLVLHHESAIRSYLNGNTDYIALCHWNMNVDNAWFWRDAEGELQAGLLDWGSVGQMNVAQAFYGLICAAETNFLRLHQRDLLALFVNEYSRAGGPSLDIAELELQLKLSIAVLGIAWILDAPTLVENEIPEVHSVVNRYDPKLKDNFLARAQLQLLNVFLDEWHSNDIGSVLQKFAAHR